MSSVFSCRPSSALGLIRFLCRPSSAHGLIFPCRPSSAHGRDFVVENIIDSRARAAAASAARLQRDLRQQEEEERWRSKPSYGKVPRYLQDVKVHLARQHADEQVRCCTLQVCKDTGGA